MNRRTAEQTRATLEQHQSASPLQKLGNIALGRYPAKSKREALKKFEAEPWTRISHDAQMAVENTKALNKLRQPMYGTYITASEAKNNDESTLFAYDQPSEVRKAIKDLFPRDMKIDPFSPSVGVGLSVKSEVNSPVSSIDIVLADNYKHFETVAITEGTLRSLGAEQSRNVEIVTEAVELHTAGKYHQYNDPAKTRISQLLS